MKRVIMVTLFALALSHTAVAAEEENKVVLTPAESVEEKKVSEFTDCTENDKCVYEYCDGEISSTVGDGAKDSTIAVCRKVFKFSQSTGKHEFAFYEVVTRKGKAVDGQLIRHK